MVRLSQGTKSKAFSLQGEVHVLTNSKCHKVIKGVEQSCRCRGGFFFSVQCEFTTHNTTVFHPNKKKNIPGHSGFRQIVLTEVKICTMHY